MTSTLRAELAASIAHEKDLSVQVNFWRTLSYLQGAEIDYLIADQVGFLDGTGTAQEIIRKEAYKVAWNRLNSAGTDLSAFPKPEEG